MYKRKRAGNTITRKINSTKDTAAKADKNHYISNSYLEGFIPIDTEYFTASPNVCFHSWSCFHGDKTAFFAVMGNLYQHTHTYANIKREKCFCINFLPISYYDKLVDTIKHNDMETDEFAVGYFTLSNAKTIHAPIIQEAFINMECTLKETQDLSGAGITAMVIGQVQHISVEKEYAQGYEQRYGTDGFMMLIPAPQDLVTGQPNQSAIATVKIERLD